MSDSSPPGAIVPARRSRSRSTLLGLGVGAGVAVAGIAVSFSVIAIPIFIAASTDPDAGLDRSLVRRGLFQMAVPFGLLLGIAVGIAVGVWFARGGRLPTGRTPSAD